MTDREVFFVARYDFVLYKSDDIRKGERFLADSTRENVLVSVQTRPVCICLSNPNCWHFNSHLGIVKSSTLGDFSFFLVFTWFAKKITELLNGVV